MSSRCIFQGELGEIRTPDVLTFVDMLGKTGSLEFERGGATKRVFWDRGEIVYADSEVPSQRIAQYLVLNGWVAPEALESLGEASRDEDAVVKTLIREDLLDAAILPRALKSLVLDIVYSLFEWEDGAFRFSVTAEAHPRKMSLKASVSNIIMEGSRRLDEWRRIREAFPEDDFFPIPAATDDVAVVSLPPLEQEILGFVDGRHSLARIVQDVPHDRFTVLGAMLTLQNAGLITVGSEPLAPAPAHATTGNGSGPHADGDALRQVVGAFNVIFAALHDRIARSKGADGTRRFAATLEKASFQRAGVFDGARFAPDGTLPVDVVLRNVAKLPDGERLPKLKGNLDRLLAQQVVQLDTSQAPEEKRAISELIAREKARLVT